MNTQRHAVGLAVTILLLEIVNGSPGAELKPASAVPLARTAGYVDSRLSNSIPDVQVAPANEKVRPTYLRDVVPIFMSKCVRCHNSEAKILPDWFDYQTAFAYRREIKQRVWNSWDGSYYKQPMPAGNGPEALTMEETERRIIKDWVETGAAYGVPSKGVKPKNSADRIELGKAFFATVCANCHQPSGRGIPGRFPPLAGSDYLNADKRRAIGVLLNGLQGEIEVNGQKYDTSMPLMPLGDEDIANTLSYVYNSFGNSGMQVTPEEVKALRGTNTAGTVAAGRQPEAKAHSEPGPWE